jgi:AcrR family transcriptional regulator
MLGTPTRDRQAERREATRREILDAAWAVAREHGLSALTLRDVADQVGMRAPSLYSHFASKNAIYDAMFGEAWTECESVMNDAARRLPRSPRAAAKKIARAFFDFSVSDLARHQLMNQRTIPGFEPTPEAYAPAVRVLEALRERLAKYGVVDDAALDLNTALVGGLIDAQQANDPGGDRWARLVDSAIDMWADYVGLPGSSRRHR